MASPTRPFRHRLLAAAFLAGIGLPMLGTVFHWGVYQGSEEKRRLAEPPPLSMLWLSSPRFYSRLKAFLTDRFGFRAALVRLHSLVLVQHLKASPNPEVVLGKDGWLFYAGDQAMEDYTCRTPFTAEQLAQWRTLLERRRDWLAARGMHYVFMVAPNAQTLYPEYLPATIRRVGAVSRLDQFLAYMKASSTVVVVDPRPALLQAKGQERLYWRTDSHWNGRGAFAASQALLAAIRQRVPGVPALERRQFRDTATDGPGGDLAALLGLTGSLRDTRLDLEPLAPANLQRREWQWGDSVHGVGALACRHTPATGPGLVMFHDSFGDALEPFLSETFPRASYLYCGMDFDTAFVEFARPDVVVQEMVERRFMTSVSGFR